MSESGNRHEAEQMHNSENEKVRESHEKSVSEVVEKLNSRGYFREGEKTALIIPPADKPEKWVAQLDADQLLTNDPDFKKLFPSPDTLAEELAAAGYRVDPCPDFEAISAEVFRTSYYLYEKSVKEK